MTYAIRWAAMALVLCGVAAMAAGCNTVRGMGQDIERGGEKIQESVE